LDFFKGEIKMGRPLNKKYFGNRNVGSNGYNNGTGDDFIGGEGLAAYTLNAQLGSLVINATYPQPTLVVPAPSEPDGQPATAQVVWEVESVTVTNGLAGHGYTTTTGGATTLTGLSGPTFNITAVGSGQGEVQVIVPVNRGSFTTVPTAVVTYQIVGGDGNNQAQVNYRVKSITTVVAGSGYIGTETFSWNDGGSHSGTMPGVPTVALTADSGSRPGYGDLNANTNQENAILIYSKTTTGGTVQLGDIKKQTNARSYKVKTANGTAVVKLVAASPSVGQATITATDSAGKTYYVIKLTAHKALLVPYGTTGHQFPTIGTEADGSPIYQSVKWTFGSATAGATVTVANA
jgi:hypothetical protein